MTDFINARPAIARFAKGFVKAGLVAAVAASLGACKHLEEENEGHLAGWTIIDSQQRHPIMVSQQPSKMTLRVTRDAHGLAPQQRAQLLDFFGRYRSQGSGSRVVVAVPSGAPNEVAAMHGLAEVRSLARDAGFADSDLVVEPYHDERDNAPPIRVSFMRYTAEGPQCGNWSTNISRSGDNLPYPNFGCAQQRNLASMIANPADLLGPRAMDDRPSERRDATWEKYRKGEATGAQKGEDEKVKVKGAD